MGCDIYKCEAPVFSLRCVRCIVFHANKYVSNLHSRNMLRFTTGNIKSRVPWKLKGAQKTNSVYIYTQHCFAATSKKKGPPIHFALVGSGFAYRKYHKHVHNKHKKPITTTTKTTITHNDKANRHHRLPAQRLYVTAGMATTSAQMAQILR